MEALRGGPEITLYTGKAHNSTSYRNRYSIATANGPLLLSVPLKGGRRNNASLSETGLDYKQSWQRQHWGALFSAYGRAPFFEHYGPELEAILYTRHESLLAFNLASIKWLCKSMQPEIAVAATEAFSAQAHGVAAQEIAIAPMPYHQVFEARWGFQPDLSAIDLLMNEGPYAAHYLKFISAS